jgi:putative transposase
MWCPKRRRKVLVGPIHDRLKEILEQVIEENAWKVLKLAIQPDQVQVCLRANPYRPQLQSHAPRDVHRMYCARNFRS